MMDQPSTFMTLDTIRTLAGQVLVVGMVTQAVRAALPTLSTYWIRGAAIGVGVILHGALVWQAGMPVSAYVLALANGGFVALTAMKAVELLKNGGAK